MNSDQDTLYISLKFQAVCTTFIGEASSDMSLFNHWLHNTPHLASKITVGGMFLGPPTMLLISMSHSIWQIVQHDEVCYFLGYIRSHNMVQLYQKLVGNTSLAKITSKVVESGRTLMEARPSRPSRSSRRCTVDVVAGELYQAYWHHNKKWYVVMALD